MLRNYLLNLINNSVEQNYKNILSLIEPDKNALMLDLGCDDGIWTSRVADKLKSKKIHGVEIIQERAEHAIKKGIKVFNNNLNEILPFADNTYDLVHSNQVIEHLIDTDLFVSEIYRVLKPGKTAIFSTENLSSWHNIFALIFGFQPFSMTNFSDKGSIGNPFALWKDQTTETSVIKSWQHNRLFSYKALVDLFEKHGFKVEDIKTAGYYPLPGFLARIDPIHGHWIAIKVRKP